VELLRSKGHALDALCDVAVAHGITHAPAWIDELHHLAARTGMRELTARAYIHRARLGDAAGRDAARILAEQLDNPAVSRLLDASG
jgi:hypothetical protein